MKRLIFILPLSFLLTSCSSQIVKKDELGQVHRAAIVGLDLQQQKSVSKEDLLSIALKTNEPNQATVRGRSESDHVTSVYQDLAGKVEKETEWKVLSADQLRQAAAYRKFFKSKTEGFQNRPMINNRFNLFE